MAQTIPTVVFLCDSPSTGSQTIDVAQLHDFAAGLAGVSEVWDHELTLSPDTGKAAKRLKSKGATRIIIAGARPGLFKNFCSKVLDLAGANGKDVLLCSFDEIAHLNGSAVAIAKSMLSNLVNGLEAKNNLKLKEYTVHPETLVIGAGIAGIQASLEIADSGNKVYLVEKTGTIGGHMATFDKTFPTLDCAACILTPKMVEVGQHNNIDLMTYSEILSVSGQPGDYKVRVLKKARRVDLATCIGCGNCAAKCPSVVLSEFDSGTTTRKAIYIPFPQAVPNKYLIEAETCRWVQEKKCGVCVKACPVTNCINLDEQDQEVELHVGNIVVATGFKTFDASRAEAYGYGKFPNVLTSLEFERLVNASGSTGGKIKFRQQDKKGRWVFTPEGGEPKSVALIHCVGSRDVNYNKYCSRVCCMYSLKLAHLLREKLPEADVFEYYIDMRAAGKGYEEFYKRILHEGVKIIRGRTATIEEKNGKLLLRSENIHQDSLIEQEVDMVILAVGLEPHPDTEKLSKMLGLAVNHDGWLTESDGNINSVGTFVGGISIAGTCQGPKDIPDTVAQASAAAARVIQSIVQGKIHMEEVQN